MAVFLKRETGSVSAVLAAGMVSRLKPDSRAADPRSDQGQTHFRPPFYLELLETWHLTGRKTMGRCFTVTFFTKECNMFCSGLLSP